MKQIQCTNCGSFKISSIRSILLIMGSCLLAGCILIITIPLFFPVSMMCFLLAPFIRGHMCLTCNKKIS